MPLFTVEPFQPAWNKIKLLYWLCVQLFQSCLHISCGNSFVPYLVYKAPLVSGRTAEDSRGTGELPACPLESPSACSRSTSGHQCISSRKNQQQKIGLGPPWAYPSAMYRQIDLSGPQRPIQLFLQMNRLYRQILSSVFIDEFITGGFHGHQPQLQFRMKALDPAPSPAWPG